MALRPTSITGVAVELKKFGGARNSGEATEVKECMTALWCALVFLTVAHQSPASQLVLEPCRQELTDLGRRAHFQGSLVYELRTSASGEIAEAQLLAGSRLGKFVEVAAIDRCVSSWKLAPDSRYRAAVAVGVPRARVTTTILGPELNLHIRSYEE